MSSHAVKQLLSHPSFTFPPLSCHHRRISSSLLAVAGYSTTLSASTRYRKKLNRKDNSVSRALIDSAVKRRTRSDKKFDEERVRQFGDTGSHIPVMLGEVLEVFDSRELCTFVDCTLGAAGHSSAVCEYDSSSFCFDYVHLLDFRIRFDVLRLFDFRIQYKIV